MKTLLTTILASAIMVTSRQAMAKCDDGELVIKFSHLTNTNKHPKSIAAQLLEKCVNEEMNGTACMQVFLNSILYDDKKVLEALLNSYVQLAAPSYVPTCLPKKQSVQLYKAPSQLKLKLIQC